MFTQARLKLTLWYVLIILSISGTFSAIVYQRISQDLARANRMFVRRELDQNFRFPVRTDIPEINNEFFEAALDRLRFTLIAINASLALLAGGAGYFLAGRTLRPIQDMVEDQRQFIADASHELRTPLTAMRTQLEVVLRDSKRTLKDANEILKSNLEEVVNLQTLTNQLLELANHNRQVNISEQIDLSDSVSQTITRLTPLAAAKSISIISHLSSVSIWMNPSELSEVVSILLDNAIKYSPEKSQIDVSVIKKGRHALLTIADHGVGIADSDLHHVFDRFYRAEKSRAKTMAPGYGLGLPIAKKILDKYHAKIVLNSRLGQGTTAEVFFDTHTK